MGTWPGLFGSQLVLECFFVQLGIKDIEIHLQINKIISAVRNFTVNYTKEWI